MAKYFGKIGFASQTEIKRGIYKDIIVERDYFGDVLDTFVKRYQNSEGVNDNVTISNRISILADPFACENCGDIRYITLHGVKWRISEIQFAHPRMILTLGDVYNENSGRSSDIT